jgi:hypothetical protein
VVIAGLDLGDAACLSRLAKRRGDCLGKGILFTFLAWCDAWVLFLASCAIITHACSHRHLHLSLVFTEPHVILGVRIDRVVSLPRLGLIHLNIWLRSPSHAHAIKDTTQYRACRACHVVEASSDVAAHSCVDTLVDLVLLRVLSALSHRNLLSILIRVIERVWPCKALHSRLIWSSDAILHGLVLW